MHFTVFGASLFLLSGTLAGAVIERNENDKKMNDDLNIFKESNSR